MVSAIEFDETGQFLAAGDRGGRVVVFDRVQPHLTSRARAGRSSRTPNVEYRFHHEFQAHDLEFDYLRSVDVEEKVNALKWLPSGSPGVKHLLTTNDKTIKLWRLWRRRLARVANLNFPASYLASRESACVLEEDDLIRLNPIVRDPAAAHAAGIPSLPSITSLDQLRVPRVVETDAQTTSIPRRTFANGHSFHINSVSPSPDGRTFLSADDLRVHIWDLESPSEAYNVTDTKPESLEQLSEVISTAQFHPKNPSIFAYGTTRGLVHICDLRDKALHDEGSIQIANVGLPSGIDQQAASFYAEFVQGVGGMAFSRDGQRLAVRDFMSLKIFDLRAPSEPVAAIPIHNQAARSFRSLYDMDYIFDRFPVRWCADDHTLVTGSYSNRFVIASDDGRSAMCAEASRTIPRRKKRSHKFDDAVPFHGPAIGARNYLVDGDVAPDAWSEQLDYARKVQFLDVHPTEPVIAAATLANLYLYGAAQRSP